MKNIFVITLLLFTAMKVSGQIAEFYGTPESFAEFHGYVHLDYVNYEMDGDNSGESYFDLHHFTFFAGARLEPNILVFSELEFVHGGAEIKIDRAYFDWKVWKYASLRIGKFYVPFGREVLTYQAPLRNFATRPMVSTELLFGEWSDIGVEIYGNIGAFFYDIAIVNGPDGISESALQFHDNNDNKFITSRISASVFGFELALSYAFGKYDDNEHNLLQFLGGDLYYKTGKLEVRGEYIYRVYDISDTKRYDSGFYVEGVYRILEELKLFTRFEGLNKNQAVKDNSDELGYSVGVLIMPYQNLKFKAEYQIKRETNGKELANNGIVLQAVIDF